VPSMLATNGLGGRKTIAPCTLRTENVVHLRRTDLQVRPWRDAVKRQRTDLEIRPTARILSFLAM
jgi:hypothetical protein